VFFEVCRLVVEGLWVSVVIPFLLWWWIVKAVLLELPAPYSFLLISLAEAEALTGVFKGCSL
jgi:hypothetical protein